MLNAWTDNGDVLKHTSNAEAQKKFASVFEEMRELGDHYLWKLLNEQKYEKQNSDSVHTLKFAKKDDWIPSAEELDVIRKRSQRVAQRTRHNMDIRL